MSVNDRYFVTAGLTRGISETVVSLIYTDQEMALLAVDLLQASEGLDRIRLSWGNLTVHSHTRVTIADWRFDPESGWRTNQLLKPVPWRSIGRPARVRVGSLAKAEPAAERQGLPELEAPPEGTPLRTGGT